MQKTRKIITAIAMTAFTALVMSGCDKYEDTPSTEQMLTAHDWKIQSLTVPSVNNPGTDSSVLQACDAECILTFSSVYDYQFINTSSGGCPGTAFVYDSGNWVYDYSNDSLHLEGVTKDYAWKVNLLTDTSLEASYLDSISPSLKWVTKIVLQNQ